MIVKYILTVPIIPDSDISGILFLYSQTQQIFAKKSLTWQSLQKKQRPSLGEKLSNQEGNVGDTYINVTERAASVP